MTDEMKEMLKEAVEMLDVTIEMTQGSLAKIAKMERKFYKLLVKEGFTSEQAMRLTASTNLLQGSRK